MKVILVTGANKGIGKAILTALLAEMPDSVLLLGSRDEGRGKEALHQVVEELGDSYKARVKLLLLDVTSDSSVETAAAKVKADYGQIYGVVNNAGGMCDGVGQTFNLNTYGVRRVCEAFVSLIQDQGRIVQISSAAGPMFVAKCNDSMKEFCVNPEVTWTQVEEQLINPFIQVMKSQPTDGEEKTNALAAKGFGEGGMGEYGASKAAVNSYTMELGKRFPKLIITSCTPGFIETDLTKPFAEKSGKTAAEMGMVGVDQGARVAVYLMTADLKSELEGFQSGWFFGSDSKRSPLHKYRGPGSPVYEGEFP